MGFSVLDPELDTGTRSLTLCAYQLHQIFFNQLYIVTIATRTKCLKDPPPQLLFKRLGQYVSVSRNKIGTIERNKAATKEEKDALISKISSLFEGVFIYMSSRTSDFDKTHVAILSTMAFIPCKNRGQIVFYLPSQVSFQFLCRTKSLYILIHIHLVSLQVFFKGERSDSLAESLFQEVEYNTFLSLAGVKAEPTINELFDLMLKKVRCACYSFTLLNFILLIQDLYATQPDEVLDSLGETKYKTILSRIAADPPFKKVTAEIRDCAFLLGYLVMDEEIASDDKGGEGNVQKAQFVLARAEDIYIVDNSFLRRQFSMLICPHEQQLEEFYNKVGSRYVSQVVKKEYEVNGRSQHNTSLTAQFASRISERKPLLLSPSVSSRPLVSDAAKLLSNLDVVEVDSINAKYTFERSSKLIPTTSCAKSTSKHTTTIFITHKFDWFDVGTAIGNLILQRCQLEDAFFLSSIMEVSSSGS